MDQEGDREISLEAVMIVHDHVKVFIQGDELSLRRETYSQWNF